MATVRHHARVVVSGVTLARVGSSRVFAAPGVRRRRDGSIDLRGSNARTTGDQNERQNE
jgi:hypothetical protein